MDVLAWPAFANKTGNPYTRLLYEAVEEQDVSVDEFSVSRALRGSYDLWHLHWPDDFLSYASPVKAAAYVCAELLLMWGARQRGTRIVWTIHDLGPHESRHPWLERVFWRFFLPMVDGYITLSHHAREAARRRFPALRDRPGAVVPHGHYRPTYPDPPPKAEARAALDLPETAPVLVYVGRIRPYKNVDRLVEVFREIADDDARLLVAGNPASAAVEQRVRTEGRGDDRVRLDLRFLPEDEMPTIVSAADLVVLPYQDILHSGSALLALSFNRPVLVPDLGAMAELRDQVGAEWVFLYDPPFERRDLVSTLQTVRRQERPAQAPLGNLEWKPLAQQTIELYRRVRAG